VEAQALQTNFHQKFGIPTERILIHPDNIADTESRAAARVTYGDVILCIPASPFPEFIAAFVQGEVVKIAAEWCLASSRLRVSRITSGTCFVTFSSPSSLIYFGVSHQSSSNK
jgi:hypothetical protein